MPGIALPPFPDEIPTHPLLIIDYALIASEDTQEIERLWRAATELGFWYLKNHGTDHEVEEMFEMGAETMDLPLTEKMKFNQGSDGQSPGYKAVGTTVTDQYDTPDTVEYITVAMDDVLAYPKVALRTYPSTVNARMESTIKPFVLKSLEINNTIISIFEKKLGLPAGALLSRHSSDEPSDSEARCIKSTQRSESGTSEAIKERVTHGAHMDYGSLSFLHNRLGGLQVLPPGSQKWQYVRPLPGHAICNIGITLTLFSGGILRSNMHRVVPAPGAQAAYTRWSTVFFTRPGRDVRLRALTDESGVIKEAVARASPEERAEYDLNVPAGEWFAKQIQYRRRRSKKVR
ncbi:hypothetical protein M0805_001037 [Coniferiporia weirii]|nr:hypothetical protein M0805_001037 [Coniferiporia weirii]